jgi:sulfite reductase (NADPH) hemoprotein beta-component
VTRHFLRHPLASSLPRKFKMAFEGCPEDHVGTAIQDIGFRALVRREGTVERRGFAVTVAGGTSSLCTSGAPLVDFLPAGDVLALAEAIVRVFHARGDRKNKLRNRLKFLVRELGFERFRALVEEALATVRSEGAPLLPFDPAHPPAEEAPRHVRPEPPSPPEIAARVRAAPPRGPGDAPPLATHPDAGPARLEAFRRTNVLPQRAAGFATVRVSLPQGDVTSPQLEALADLAASYGDGTVRLASAGQLHLRWVRDGDVPALHVRLSAAGLARDGVGSAADVVACPGAEVCRIAVTRTRGVARLVEARVRTALGATALEAPLSIRVSGCPNGCSQHHVAAIGLQGSARKLGGRSVPQYFVLLGGGAAGRVASFGKLAAKIPARRVPEAIERLVALYLAGRSRDEGATQFFARSHACAAALLAPLEELRVEDARAEDFVEPGATDEFRPATQEGECAA